MRNLRLAVRLVLATSVSGLLALACLVGAPVAWLARALPRWRSFITQLWGRSLGWVLGMRVTCEGRPPDGAALLVTNHLSYVDILLLAGRLPCVFVSKAEVSGWPGIGLLARLSGTVFVDRAQRRDVVRVGELLQRHVAAGRTVVLFPEGTSTAGEDVAPFLSSLLEPAAALGLPVHFAALGYRTPGGEVPARLSVAWWGDAEFGRHALDLLRLPWFEARIAFGGEPVQSGDRKELALALERAVRSLLWPRGTGRSETAGEEACPSTAGS